MFGRGAYNEVKKASEKVDEGMDCSIRRPGEVMSPDDAQCCRPKLVLHGILGGGHPRDNMPKHPSSLMPVLLDQIKGLVEPSARETHSLFPATDSHGENKLIWSSSSVVWSVGGVQRRKWTFTAHTQEVVAASFAWFDIQQPRLNPDPQGSSTSRFHQTSLSSSTFGPFTLMRDTGLNSRSRVDSKLNQPPALCICILHRDIGHIYSHDGLEFTIHLPVTVEKLWPLSPVGLMLRVAETDILPSPLASDSTPPAPRHYSLVTPFDEMRPVVERSMASDSSMQSTTCDVSPLPSHEQIIHVSRGLPDNARSAPPLVVTVDTMRMHLRILRYETQGNLGDHFRVSSVGHVDEKPTREETAPLNETLTGQFRCLNASYTSDLNCSLSGRSHNP